MEAEDCTKLDYIELQKCCVLLAFPGNSPSGGVHIELEWGSMAKIPILLCLNERGSYSNLVAGLKTILNVKYIVHKDPNECLKQINAYLEEKVFETKDSM